VWTPLHYAEAAAPLHAPHQEARRSCWSRLLTVKEWWSSGAADHSALAMHHNHAPLAHRHCTGQRSSDRCFASALQCHQMDAIHDSWQWWAPEQLTGGALFPAIISALVVLVRVPPQQPRAFAAGASQGQPLLLLPQETPHHRLQPQHGAWHVAWAQPSSACNQEAACLPAAWCSPAPISAIASGMQPPTEVWYAVVCNSLVAQGRQRWEVFAGRGAWALGAPASAA
jgi:hypothetical protein